MGIYRYCKHKEQSNSFPSVREISYRLATRKNVNSIAVLYIRPESSLPEGVYCILQQIFGVK